jgi:iron(III) transport system ATP-binding protein
VVMNQGIIEQIGTPVEIYRFPNSRFVADFIGRANFVAGEVQGKRDGHLAVKAFGQTIELTNIQRDFNRLESVTLIVRPEMTRIKKTGEIFQGVIRRAVFLGDVIEYDVETDPTVMELFPVGEQVTVGWAMGCIRVLPGK